MNKKLLGLSLVILQACATSKPATTPPSSSATPETADATKVSEGIEEKMDARVQENAQTEATLPTPAPETPAAPPPRAPVIGVWVDGAGVESFLALGFMQELQRAGVKFAKVVGTGWGCWMAVSWAQEASANQAEWQAFKWSSWAPLGLERGFLSRIRGERGSFEDFSRDLRVWLPKDEFAELAMPADCPVVANSGTMDLVSTHSLGISRALWEELQAPLFDKKVTAEAADKIPYLSGLAAGDPRPEEYDRFAETSSAKNAVEFWIHLKTTPASVLASGDRWLSAAFTRREPRGETWSKTKQGRWVMKMPLFVGQNLDEKKSLDFGSRRAWLLRGREMAKKWMQSAWFKSNLAPAFATPET
jgi:hypothetical protein